MRAYVVRDRPAQRGFVIGGLASTAVAVGLGLASGRWWIVVVALPFALLTFVLRAGRESTLLRADEHGLARGSQQVPWAEVAEVLVGPDGVVAVLRADARPAPGSGGHVADPRDPDSRQRWSVPAALDPREAVTAIRALAPSEVRVSAAG